jgi:hypothetical protein
MNLKLILLAAGLVAAAGCASSSGKQESLRNATFATGKDGASIGTVTVTRTIDPKSGKAVSETVTATNVATFTERDRSKVGARGLLAIQTVEQFNHERQGFLGSSSKSGVKAYSADPDEQAITAGGQAAKTTLEGIAPLINPVPKVSLVPTNQPAAQPAK